MNREHAITLLNKHCSADDSWRAHCLQVGAAARRLAELISQRGYAIDVDRAEVLGLLHDLGRSQEHSLRHGIEGCLLAQAEGFEEEGRICLAHILKGRTLQEGVRLGMLTQDEEKQMGQNVYWNGSPSLEEKIVILADALMSDTGLATIEQKYANARLRYGGQPHHYEDEAWVKGVAAEIEQLLGMSPHDALQGLRDDLLR
jgi:putative nucleotidyltransferase with HDIG domain